MIVCSDLASISDIFTKFNADYRQQNLKTFNKGLKFFTDALKFDTGRILNGLEEEIGLSDKAIKDLELVKEKEISSMIAQIESMMTSSLSKLTLLAPSTFEVKKALKSMRKLPLLGDATKKVDFEFPTVSELRELCKGEHIKTVSFKFSACGNAKHPTFNAF